MIVCEGYGLASQGEGMNSRRKTRKVRVGNVFVGGDAPISIQSMANTDTRDVDATVAQIRELTVAGCDIVRVAVPDEKAASLLGEIKRQIGIPLVADIHFSADLALIAVAQGIDKLRINPGNIGSRDRVERLVAACRERGIPIRIGVNAGSLEKDLVKKYGSASPEAMVESALGHVAILEENGFDDILISLKASDVDRTVRAYRLLSQKVDYPLHIGVTEAGTAFRGTVLSSMGLAILLYDGIGDTLRVSLTASPVEEIRVAREILAGLGLRKGGITITSCPTCGRTEVDLINLAHRVEEALRDVKKEMHVAVMGCVVNGPGEAREADLAIVGGKGVGLIVKHGEVLRKVAEGDLLDEFLKEVHAFGHGDKKT
jgi:(E)-4-hydroxy-3-methylbut-2-enyl-diphosphate synthase